jgi:DNA-binding MarR family transcriptional regulator
MRPPFPKKITATPPPCHFAIMKHAKFSKERHEKWRTFLRSLTPEIEAQSMRLMEQMRLVGHMLGQIGETSVDAAGLSYAKYRLLLGLLFSEQAEGQPELNPSEISERQGTSRNTISALIRDLEEEGLIARTLDPDDRRRFNIRLTENGRSLVRDHASRHLHMISQCFSSLTSQEQRQLSELLSKIGESAEGLVNSDH